MTLLFSLLHLFELQYIIAIMTLLSQLFALYTLYSFLHLIKTVVFATVVPNDAGQRSSDEDHWPSRPQTPPTPPVQAEPSESSCARSTS